MRATTVRRPHKLSSNSQSSARPFEDLQDATAARARSRPLRVERYGALRQRRRVRCWDVRTLAAGTLVREGFSGLGDQIGLVVQTGSEFVDVEGTVESRPQLVGVD